MGKARYKNIWPQGTLVDAKNLEFPKFWSHNAASITGSKYFRGSGDKRETSVKQMINRVVKILLHGANRLVILIQNRSQSV